MMIFFLEFLTFFRSHRGKLFFKSMLPVAMCPVAMPMSSKTPEKNVGKDKQSCQNVSIGPWKRSGTRAFHSSIVPKPNTKQKAAAMIGIAINFTPLGKHQHLIMILLYILYDLIKNR
jgi:hypothetical protein